MKKAKTITKVEIPNATIEIKDDGILYVHSFAAGTVGIDICKTIFDATCQITNYKAYPKIFHASNYGVPDEAARAFLVSQERCKYTTADAYIIESLAQRIVGNFFLKVNQPPVPTKFFKTIDAAREWLKQYPAKL